MNLSCKKSVLVLLIVLTASFSLSAQHWRDRPKIAYGFGLRAGSSFSYASYFPSDNNSGSIESHSVGYLTAAVNYWNNYSINDKLYLQFGVELEKSGVRRKLDAAIKPTYVPFEAWYGKVPVGLMYSLNDKFNVSAHIAYGYLFSYKEYLDNGDPDSYDIAQLNTLKKSQLYGGIKIGYMLSPVFTALLSGETTLLKIRKEEFKKIYPSELIFNLQVGLSVNVSELFSR